MTLNDVFDVDPTEPKVQEGVTPPNGNDDIDADYEFLRQELYQLIQTGKDVLSDAVSVARESEHPRAYEVVGQLIKTNSDNLDKLMKLHRDTKDVKKEESSAKQVGPSKVVNNTLFVGSTADLLKQIAGQMEE